VFELEFKQFASQHTIQITLAIVIERNFDPKDFVAPN
jgi:hypothetical protein